jgi:hypothetical protein
MAVTAHVFPNFTQQMGEKNAGGSTSQITLTNANSGTVDTLKVALFTGTFNWVSATQAYTTIGQFLSNSGSGGGGALTEVTGTGYSRQALTTVTYTTSGLVNTLTCANPSWSASTFTANYAAFYDYTTAASSDTNGLLICYWDLGGAQSVSGSTFTLTISGSGLVTWTSS